MAELKIRIRINGKPLEEYEAGELEAVKAELTYKAFSAAGYKRGKTNE